jgi:hypothetical protein
MIPFNRWDLRYFASITCVLAPLRQPGQEGFMAAKYSVPVLKVLDRSTASKIETETIVPISIGLKPILSTPLSSPI